MDESFGPVRRVGYPTRRTGRVSGFEAWGGQPLTIADPLQTMKCPYCGRAVRLFNLGRSNPVKKVLPRCQACHRYVLTAAHKAVLAALALAAILTLLWFLRVL